MESKYRRWMGMDIGMSKEELVRALEKLVAQSKQWNLHVHGREDCKSCSLIENLDALLAEARK